MKRAKSLLIVLLLISTLFVVQYVFILPNVSGTIKELWNSSRKKVIAPADYVNMGHIDRVISTNSVNTMLDLTYRHYFQYYPCRIREWGDVWGETGKEGETAFAFPRDPGPAAEGEYEEWWWKWSSSNLVSYLLWFGKQHGGISRSNSCLIFNQSSFLS